MHESALVRQLLDRMEAAAGDSADAITSVRLKIGALASASPDGLASHLEMAAIAAWGYSPLIEIETSDDPSEEGALGVVLQSVKVEV